MHYKKFELSVILADELPKRLHGSIIYATFYSPSKEGRQILLLTKSLEVLEIKSAEIIRAIDLSQSKLADLKLEENSEPSRGISPALMDSCEEVSEISDGSSEPFKFGKYVYVEGSVKRFYILLNAFDKLLILERCQLEFKLTQQYDNVDRYEIMDPRNSFRPKVNIIFKSSEMLETTFETKFQSEKDTVNTAAEMEQNIQKSKIELSVHKSFTKKDYIKLKNFLTFGPNHLRSHCLEEKQLLRQCGDTWMKFFNDNLLIGIPVKNCCIARPTTLENVRVVLICPETERTQYEYTLFQLVDDSCTYENFEKLLECESQVNLLQFQKEWLPVKDQVLQPKCSGVIVLRMKWEIDMVPRAFSYLVFVLYDITSAVKTFTQQYRIQDIVIKPEIFFKDEYKVKFKDIELYQDLLIVSASSFLKGIQIEYQTDNPFLDISNFLNYELGFTYIKGSKQNSEAMEIDDPLYQQSNSDTSREEMYLNKENACSYWYGTLLRLRASDKNIISMKIYTKSEDKVLMLAQLLYKNMKNKIKILPVSCTNKGISEKVRELEDKLRTELQLATKFCENSTNSKLLKRSDIFQFQQELLARELESDLAVMNLS